MVVLWAKMEGKPFEETGSTWETQNELLENDIYQVFFVQ